MKFIVAVLMAGLVIFLVAIFFLVKLIREIKAEVKSRHTENLWDEVLFKKAAKEKNSLTPCPHGYVSPSIFRE